MKEAVALGERLLASGREAEAAFGRDISPKGHLSEAGRLPAPREGLE